MIPSIHAMLPDWLETYEPHLTAIAAIIAIISVPVGVAVFIWEKRRERIDREYGTYISLSDKYIEFLGMCFENPELDIFETSLDEQCLPLLSKKDPRTVQKELILYTIFITMCERAYLVYREHSSKIKTCQWAGWEEYIKDYCRYPNFRAAWLVLGKQFDTEFVAHVNALMRETESSGPRVEGAAPSTEHTG
ncbi:MAG: hypothetical protein HY735_29630 [Verrucomicrobia bacterium]|nr:hypothetical protein [Verrucomicrobiota bacterium]